MSFRHSGPRRHHSSGLGWACGSGFIILGSPSSLALATPCVHHLESPPSPRALRCHALCTRPPATPRGRGPAGAGQVTYSGHNNHLTKPVPAARRPGSGGAWLQLCVCAMTSRSAAAVQVGRGSCVEVGGAQQCAVYSYISSHRHN